MGPGSGRILPSFLPLAVTNEVLLVKMCWICQQKWLDSGRSRKLDRVFYMLTGPWASRNRISDPVCCQKWESKGLLNLARRGGGPGSWRSSSDLGFRV